MSNNYMSDAELTSALAKIKNAYTKAFLFIFPFLFILASCLYALLNVEGSTFFACLAGAGMSVFVLFLICLLRLYTEKKLKKFFAESLVPACLSRTLADFEYKADDRLNDDILKMDMHFSKRIDGIEGSNYLKGSYRELNFEMSSIKLSAITSVSVNKSGKTSERKEQFFTGAWCVFDIKKALNSDIWIASKGSLFNLSALPVSTQNKFFNRHFTLSTDAPSEAFNILTPHIIDCLENMSKKFKGPIHFYFSKDAKLCMAINSGKALFDLAFNCTLEKAKKTIEQDFSSFSNFVDELMLIPYYKD